MIHNPAPRHWLSNPTLTPFSKEFYPLYVNALANQAWPTASKAVFFPFTVFDPFVVLKTFYSTGTTVGTNSLDIGVYEMTDLTTGRCDLIRSIGQTLHAGSSNSINEIAVTRTAVTNLTANSDSTDSQTYTTASVTLKAGRLYLMSVENSHGSSATAVSSIDNTGTWNSRSTIQYNTNLNRVSIWSYVPSADYTGTLVINFGATTQTGCVWSLIEMSGVDTTTNDGIVQNATGTGNSGTALATLSAFGSTANATFAAHGHAAATASAPGTGFTEMSDNTAATPAQALCTDWRVDNDTTADATFTSAQWGSCAVEVKASTAPFVVPASTATYMAMTVNGTTANFSGVAPSSVSVFREQGVLEVASQFPLPSTCTPVTLTANVKAMVSGFSRRSLLA